jgi:hypothetical protein
VEAAGFKKSVTQQVALSVNDALTLDMKLEVGQVSEIVTVSEAPSAVNTETSVLGKPSTTEPLMIFRFCQAQMAAIPSRSRLSRQA